jgi:hypothetical protein
MGEELTGRDGDLWGWLGVNDPSKKLPMDTPLTSSEIEEFRLARKWGDRPGNVISEKEMTIQSVGGGEFRGTAYRYLVADTEVICTKENCTQHPKGTSFLLKFRHAEFELLRPDENRRMPTPQQVQGILEQLGYIGPVQDMAVTRPEGGHKLCVRQPYDMSDVKSPAAETLTGGNTDAQEMVRNNEPLMYVVYNRPRDYPNNVVVREWLGETATQRHKLFDSLEEARAYLATKPRMGKIPRHESDALAIVETWMVT